MTALGLGETPAGRRPPAGRRGDDRLGRRARGGAGALGRPRPPGRPRAAARAAHGGRRDPRRPRARCAPSATRTCSTTTSASGGSRAGSPPSRSSRRSRAAATCPDEIPLFAEPRARIQVYTEAEPRRSRARGAEVDVHRFRPGGATPAAALEHLAPSAACARCSARAARRCCARSSPRRASTTSCSRSRRCSRPATAPDVLEGAPLDPPARLGSMRRPPGRRPPLPALRSGAVTTPAVAPARPHVRRAARPPAPHGHRQRRARTRSPTPCGSTTLDAQVAHAPAARRRRAPTSSTWAASRGVTYTAGDRAGGRDRARRAARRAAGGRGRRGVGRHVEAGASREAALDAGAAMINDTSGLARPRLADAVRARRAPRSSSCTRGRRPSRSASPTTAATSSATSSRSCASGCAARARGAASPTSSSSSIRGPTSPRRRPRRSRCCARSTALAALGRPLLLAVSRKYFVGAITGRPPASALAGTLAARRLGGGRRRRDRPRPRRRRGGRLPRASARVLARRAPTCRSFDADDERAEVDPAGG